MSAVACPSMAATIAAERNSHDLARDHLSTARVVLRQMLEAMEYPGLTDRERQVLAKCFREFMNEFGGGL